MMQIAPAKQGSVTITAPFSKSRKKHILFKGTNQTVCITGVLPNTARLPGPGNGLKNSAHGHVITLGIKVPFAAPFCDISKDACLGATPSCQNMKFGDEVELCSSLMVPTVSPNTDVDVTWKVLWEEKKEEGCEQTFPLEDLKAKGKLPLACLKIPARVQDKKNK